MVWKMIFKFIVSLCILMLFACSKSSDNKSSENNNTQPINFKAAMERGPDYKKAALANVELGLGYLTQGQVARAKTKLTHALQLAPNLPDVHSAMAHFQEMVGDLKEAEKEHKKAISLSSSKGGAVYNNYGAYLCRRGQFKEADQAFHNAIQDKNYARTAEVYENAGLCALKWPGHEKEAGEYLITAIKRDPNRASAVLELASLNFKQDNIDGARDLLAQYRNIAEPSARSLWLGIQVGRALQDEDMVASQGLMLKELFQNSREYKMFLKTEQSGY